MNAAWPKPRSKPYHWVAYCVVHDRWKLSVNRDASYVELYDLVADPFEKTDVSEQQVEVVRSLKKKLEAWKATLPAKPTGDVFSSERNVGEKKNSQRAPAK